MCVKTVNVARGKRISVLLSVIQSFRNRKTRLRTFNSTRITLRPSPQSTNNGIQSRPREEAAPHLWYPNPYLRVDSLIVRTHLNFETPQAQHNTHVAAFSRENCTGGSLLTISLLSIFLTRHRCDGGWQLQGRSPALQQGSEETTRSAYRQSTWKNLSFHQLSLNCNITSIFDCQLN